MKIGRFNLQYLLLLFVLFFLNCSVSNDPLVCPEQFTGELLENETKLVGQWRASGAISNVEVDLTNDNVENPSFNMFEQFSECAKDAIFNFDRNREYAYDLGTVTTGCTRTNTVGTWKLSSNELQLIVSCGSIDYNVTFNGDNSQFEYTSNIDVQEVNGSLTPARVTFTFSKVEP